MMTATSSKNSIFPASPWHCVGPAHRVARETVWAARLAISAAPANALSAEAWRKKETHASGPVTPKCSPGLFTFDRGPVCSVLFAEDTY